MTRDRAIAILAATGFYHAKRRTSFSDENASLTLDKAPPLVNALKMTCSYSEIDSYSTCAPNGHRDNFAILNSCIPMGMPMILMQ